MGATVAANEFVGLCRFGGWADEARTEPIVVSNPSAWVQVAATSKDQTRTTMRIFPSLFSKAAVREYEVDVGREIIYAHHGRQVIEAVTSSPRALEGGRASLILCGETQHWLGSNGGHEMTAVIDRNAAKVKGGGARPLALTNAYDPSEESVAQADREAFEAMESGESTGSGLLYDSLEAPADAPMTAEAIPAVLEAVRGDSHWLSIERLTATILDPRNPPARSRRFFFNQIVAVEDAWIDPRDLAQCVAGEEIAPLAPGEEIALFGDGSKSDDATGLVGCRLSDGLVVTLGMWQRPPGKRGEDWTTPRAVVDERVDQVHTNYRVAAFFFDPSHAQDDETAERYWDGLCDEWHARYSGRLEVWAVSGKVGGHAVMWDMVAPSRVERFTAAAERCAAEIGDHTLRYDGDGRLRTHARNARRYPNRYGVSLWKGHRESKRKIDLAVCMVGARMLRRLVLMNPDRARRRSGRVW